MFGRSLGMRRNNLLFAYLMLAPAIIMLVALNIYPFLTALYSSFYSIHTITREASWVGLENFRSLLQSALFWQSFGRSLLWMVPGVSIQLVLGIAISLLLHQELRGRWVARGIVLFPYLVPAIVATLVWRFMFNPLTGVINYLLVDVLSVIDKPIAWLAGKNTALLGVVIVGIWKFVPFMVILFLSALADHAPGALRRGQDRWGKPMAGILVCHAPMAATHHPSCAAAAHLMDVQRIRYHLPDGLWWSALCHNNPPSTRPEHRFWSKRDGKGCGHQYADGDSFICDLIRLFTVLCSCGRAAQQLAKV